MPRLKPGQRRCPLRRGVVLVQIERAGLIGDEVEAIAYTMLAASNLATGPRLVNSN